MGGKPGRIYPKMLDLFARGGVWVLISPLCFSVCPKFLPGIPIPFMHCEEMIVRKKNPKPKKNPQNLESSWRVRPVLRIPRYTPDSRLPAPCKPRVCLSEPWLDCSPFIKGKLQREDVGVEERMGFTETSTQFSNACIYSLCNDLSSRLQFMVS